MVHYLLKEMLQISYVNILIWEGSSLDRMDFNAEHKV